MNLWESVKELICFCERVDFVHLYAQPKLIFALKVFQSASDVLLICGAPVCVQCHVKMPPCVKNLTRMLVISVVIMLKEK